MICVLAERQPTCIQHQTEQAVGYPHQTHYNKNTLRPGSPDAASVERKTTEARRTGDYHAIFDDVKAHDTRAVQRLRRELSEQAHEERGLPPQRDGPAR